MDMKEMMVIVKLALPVLLLLTSTPSVSARPPTISLRSADRDIQTTLTETDLPMSIADGILRDYMMAISDSNGDQKLSESEITSFFRDVAHYTEYVSNHYGQMFIEIADFDHDQNLDNDELLLMLIEMNVSNWLR